MENERLTQKIVKTSLAADPSSCTSATKQNLADARLKVSTLTNILHYESVRLQLLARGRVLQSKHVEAVEHQHLSR